VAHLLSLAEVNHAGQGNAIAARSEFDAPELQGHRIDDELLIGTDRLSVTGLEIYHSSTGA
jgi:hypothetical protein